MRVTAADHVIMRFSCVRAFRSHEIRRSYAARTAHPFTMKSLLIPPNLSPKTLVVCHISTLVELQGTLSLVT